MVDTMKKTTFSKPHVSLGMYRSSYKRDYEWPEESLSDKDMQKLQIADSQLKAKEFAVPQEKKVVPYSDDVVCQEREVIPAPSIEASRVDETGGRKPEEGCLPRCYPTTALAGPQAERLERLQALAVPENELCLPADGQTAGTAGMLLHGQKLVPTWATYQQFIMETGWARQNDARKNKSLSQSSVDFEGQGMEVVAAAPWGVGGQPLQKERNLWVSEYKDNYSIFLRKLSRSPQIPGAELGLGLSLGMDTAQEGNTHVIQGS
ncbi:uncharacterized protein [Patagioenas fasciata]|uniref:uncharacterized protein n=1 Tax=Patagioenas fasciata TaxID=372321 RepID=UPI003A99F36A